MLRVRLIRVTNLFANHKCAILLDFWLFIYYLLEITHAHAILRFSVISNDKIGRNGPCVPLVDFPTRERKRNVDCSR